MPNLKYALSEDVFYSLSNDNIVRIVSLHEDDDRIISIDGIAADLFLSIFTEDSESTRDEIIKKSRLSKEKFQEFNDSLLKELKELKIVVLK